MKKHLLTSLLLLFSIHLFAEIRPSLLLSDNMVLQQNATLPIWGWADKGEKVTVSFNGQTLTAKPDRSGKWRVTLEPMPSGGPYEMTFSSKKDKVTINNVMIGEVWICSGQSNMEWDLKRTENAEDEIAHSANTFIRHFNVSQRMSPAPLDSLDEGQWEMSSPETAGDFTAVGYYFAKELQKKLGVAIGLINTSWGGTAVEAWMSAGAAKKFPEFEEQLTDLAEFYLPSYQEKRKKFQEKQIELLESKLGFKLPSTDEGMTNGKAIWANTDLDDEEWASLEMPSIWERKGLEYLDGVVWFRKALMLPEDFDSESATLHLTKIDDADITWVNGVKVGGMDGYDKERVYAIDAGLLKSGRNSITVRVEDNGGGGGFTGVAKEFKLSFSSGKEISLAGNWKYKIAIGSVGQPEYLNTSFPPSNYPALLYNGMVKALIPYAIKGTIWYQGEANVNRAYQYQKLFPEMISDWRDKFKQGDFPFLFVQLANFLPAQPEPKESAWAELREAQSMALSLPNTGQATIIDIGNADDIHPRNKKDVGKRLALNARKIAYGEDLVHSGPIFHSLEIEEDKVRIKFKHIGGGLIAKNKYGYLQGFTIAGADKKFVWAKAEMVGDEVIVYSEKIAEPVSVRYAWADNPDDANLYNKEGLPASPFRTDNWDGITKN